jgi:hypothetical protein
MNMDNYPHVTIVEDGSLCSTGQHRPGFSRVLYDALRQLGYNGDGPVYRGRISMAHGQDKCEVNVVIPLNPTEPWMATIIGVKLDETIEQQDLELKERAATIVDLEQQLQVLQLQVPPAPAAPTAPAEPDAESDIDEE